MTQDALLAMPAAPPRVPAPTPRRRAAHPGQHLEVRKHWRGVRALRCRACHTPILAGLDADECALRVRVDVTPVSALGEAMALLAGRRTFTLRRDLARSIVLIERRTAASIARRPAGAPSKLDMLAWDVHVEHCCSQPTPDPLTATARLIDEQATFDPDQPPPF